MKKLSVNHPIIYEFILIVIAFVVTFAFVVVGQMAGQSNEMSGALGRIATGLLLMIVLHRCFRWRKLFSGLIVMLPALLFALWNVANHYLTKGDYAPLTVEILILGLAPAIFEEVLFRGVFIHNLKAHGMGKFAVLIIPAVLFGIVHLTNAVNGQVLQALVQTGYSIVVGLVFGAIYIKTEDLLSVIIAHAVIDITNRVFLANTNSSTTVLIIFIALLAVEAIYAFWLVARTPEPQKVAPADE
ncbi:MAG: CPBP family intramembrane metalloprotease [Mogibacterium sp.]|nr:CPBP family intramembrane metalloprotease [Mogibacterium sp.]